MITPATAMAQPLWVDIASKPYNGHLLKREKKHGVDCADMRRLLHPPQCRVISAGCAETTALVVHYVAFMGPQKQGVV